MLSSLLHLHLEIAHLQLVFDFLRQLLKHSSIAFLFYCFLDVLQVCLRVHPLLGLLDIEVLAVADRLLRAQIPLALLFLSDEHLHVVVLREDLVVIEACELREVVGNLSPMGLEGLLVRNAPEFVLDVTSWDFAVGFAVLAKELYCFSLTAEGSPVQGCVQAFVLGVGVCALRQQERDHLALAVGAGQVQSSVACLFISVADRYLFLKDAFFYSL